jgi:NADPH2:quinone reductase
MPPKTMTAIEAKGVGGPEVLVAGTRPVPEPGPGEVLIEVAAAGINRPDVVQRQGLYPPPKGASDLLGLEVAGIVVKRGQGASRFKDGDRVCALVNGGGYAEYAVAPEATTLSVPEGLSMVEAAALPETIFTVWHNVFERAALALGAARAINYRDEDFVEAVRVVTGGEGANVILDMVGGDYIERNLRAAALEGRIVQIAFLKGAKVEIDLMRLMLRRLTLTGSTLRAQTQETKVRIARGVEERVWPLIAQGKVKAVIDSTFSLDRAAEAHRRIDDPGHIGKIVLEIRKDA